MRKIFLFVVCAFFVFSLDMNIFADTHKISYQEALNMALNNNDSLKQLEENIEYLDEQKNKAQTDLSTAINTTDSTMGDPTSKVSAQYTNIMHLIQSLKKYEDDISDYGFQKKIKSDISELSLRNHLINIKSYGLDIDILKKDIELDKSNLRVSEIKRDHGLMSDLDFAEAQDKLTEKNNKLNDYYTKLKNERQSLNKLLGLDINSENEFELELPTEQFTTDVETHILNQFNSSPALEIQRKKVDQAQYAVDSYDSLLTDSEIKTNNDLNDAMRTYDDLVKNLQKMWLLPQNIASSTYIIYSWKGQKTVLPCIWNEMIDPSCRK